jgi:hypothetical protein
MWPERIVDLVPQALQGPAFWLASHPAPDEVLIDAAGITDLNARVHDAIRIPSVTASERFDPPLLDEGLAGRARPFDRPLYRPDGRLLPNDEQAHLLANATGTPVDRFGLVWRRSSLRRWPTEQTLTAQPFELAFDRLQETTLDAGWPVHAVVQTADGAWSYVLAPHYWGWLRTDAIAWCTYREVLEWASMAPVVTAVASRLPVFLPDGIASIQMGTVLPVRAQYADHLELAVPRRDEHGTLTLVTGIVPSAADGWGYTLGALPLTPRTLIERAFSLLGEPYAWGGSLYGWFGRDCSRFVRDVYATTGVLLPRNTGQQAACTSPVLQFTPDQSPEHRQRLLSAHARAGDLLFLPGHVMLYLGSFYERQYVIHATAGSIMQVAVTDLLLPVAGGKRLLDQITSLNRVTQTGW